MSDSVYPQPLQDRIGASVVRTVTPLIVAALVSLFAKAKLDVDATLASEAIGTGVGALYYAGVRLLETRVAPAWGKLLGTANAPKYDA